jgi:hypothetical protein
MLTDVSWFSSAPSDKFRDNMFPSKSFGIRQSSYGSMRYSRDSDKVVK